MSTMNFSVPDNVKEAFNDTFNGQNKSAIIVDLMREAIERYRLKQRSHDAIGGILERRRNAPFLSENEIRDARKQGRQ